MGLNLRGKNLWKLGKHEEAEKCFIKSLHMLPCRMYPHYLLAKLYLDPAFKDEKKFLTEAYFIRDMVPKIRSQATDEMKEEINRLLTNKH